MEFKYTPLNLHGSKKLFTGRTKIISKILKNLFDGRSIAIFGERQIGKTLLLWMIKDIINDKINTQELIDGTLKDAIPEWKSELKNTRAILINMEKCGSDESVLFDNFFRELKKNGISFQTEKGMEYQGGLHNSLNELLEKLSKTLPLNIKLIILMDEMECLEKYPNSSDLAGVLRDASNRYENLKFIHTGSYHWEARIRQLGKGSPWNHLRNFYLGGIDENDARNYLIKPLAQKFQYENTNNELANKIVECSGCKPLLIQEICDELYKFKELPDELEIENILLGCDNIKRYIRENIFEEEQLDGYSQKILKFLSHKPASRATTISKRLNMKLKLVKRKLEEFDKHHFDAIRDEKQKIRINGKLIERFGKEKYGEEDFLAEEVNGNKKIILKKEIPRWMPVFILLLLATILFFYSHSKKKPKEFSFSNFKIILEVPTSLEVDEEGALNLSIQNISNNPIELLKISFFSNVIEYQNKGSNVISLTKLLPLETRTFLVNYRVRNVDSDVLESKISIAGIKAPILFNINKRLIQAKKYSGELISYLIGLLGFILLILNIGKSFGKRENK